MRFAIIILNMHIICADTYPATSSIIQVVFLSSNLLLFIFYRHTFLVFASQTILSTEDISTPDQIMTLLEEMNVENEVDDDDDV